MSKNLALGPEQYAYLVRMRSRAGDPLLAELRRETERVCGGDARMLATEEQGDFFTLLAGALGVKSAVEVGTFTGFSSLCLARGLAPGGRLLCCDVSAEWTAIARRYWQRAGVEDRIELRLGPAAETLAALEPGRSFDFAFIDADKTGYDRYYELLLPRMRPGGLLVFDNMLSHGDVVAPRTERDRALDALNRKLAADPRVESVLLPIADGLHFCRKK
ncbi:MAG TPA: class I SAM-dependent methyltransferase [Opitutaceae bacterium]|nr:class I SAM-dependent methyltransferase [Opitutaceae bacterium]